MAEKNILDEIVQEDEEDTPSPQKIKLRNEEREALAILAATGYTKEYLGKEFSLGDIHKLSEKEVDRLHLRYQAILGKEVERSLSEGFLRVACRAITHVLNIFEKQLDDEKALLSDLQNDALIRRELSYGAGWIAIHGGRLTALAAVLTHVGCHTQAKNVDDKLDN